MTWSKACASAIFGAALLAMSGCGAFGPATKSAGGEPSVATAPAKSSPKPVTAEDPPEKRFKAALAHMSTRDYGKAEPILKSLTQTHAQLPGPHANLGILYARTQRNALAIEELRRAVAINPRLAAAQNQLGALLRQSGDLRGAEQAYQAAIAADSDYAAAHLNLGVLYDVYLKQPARALPHYERYQKLTPADIRASVWIAELKQRTAAR